MKICKLELVHKGENFPCLEMNPQTVTADASIHENFYTYEDPEDKRCGSAAELTFQQLYNWGGDPKDHPIEQDLSPDMNSIKVNVYLRVGE